MGNMLSRHSARGGPTYYECDDGHFASKPFKPNTPHCRGGDAPQDANGGVYNNGWRAERSAPRSGAGYGRLSPQRAEEAQEDDFCEVPAQDFYAATQGLGRSRRLQNKACGRSTPVGYNFDFNDNQQPNPWRHSSVQPELELEREPQRARELEAELEVRRFANCRDQDLRTYLASRLITPGFLTEIDQFIQGHPEIASCPEGRTLLHQLSTLPPLQAYKCFLKGYTRPARYIEGVVRTEAFTLPAEFAYEPLITKTDPELLDFFDGFQYRHDIIERIDQEVYAGMMVLVNGQQISLGLRKLVCYAVWGNPVDAYKHFEYSYQNEYMPHRYLPEHVILGHIPKPINYSKPRPTIDTSYKRHYPVRARMSRANDQGVDVLEVLIAEYRFAIVRKGYRRAEIDDLVLKVKQRLEVERQNPTGAEIVDLIMDDAVSREGPKRSRNTRGSRPRNHKTYNLRAFKIASNGVRMNGGTHTFTRVNKRRAPGFLQAQAAELRQAKAVLVRLYTQENHIVSNRGLNTRESSLQIIRASRASAERRYVNCLIRYCRDANRMTPFQAKQLQNDFTREKMGDLGVSNSDYLLGMYPRELY